MTWSLRSRAPGACAAPAERPRPTRSLDLARAALFAVALLAAASAQAAADGVALHPQLGWSSWSSLRMNISQAIIEAQAQAMSTSGLKDAGYVYVNVDDGWYLDPTHNVDANGRWAVDTAKFPGGIKALARYIHKRGLKLGWYLTPGIPVAAYDQNTPIKGTAFHARDIVSDTDSRERNYNFGNSMYYIDYARNPAAAQAYLDSWARQLATWGVDYLKIDGVGTWDSGDVLGWYQALLHSGRQIHLELSNALDVRSGNLWRHNANSWRIDGDIECYCDTLSNWGSVRSRFNDAPPWTPFAGPGAWNDLDSLESSNGLSMDERRSQVSLWAMNAAPLLLGLDLTQLSADDLAVVANPEVIAIDQAGNPGHPLTQDAQQAWVAYGDDGRYTVGLFNLADAPADVGVTWNQLGFSGAATVRDAWARSDLGSRGDGYSASLPAHGSALLTVTPPAGSSVTSMLVSPATSRCLTGSAAAGSAATISDCGFPRGNDQVLTYGADQSLRVNGLCLDVYDQGTAAGTAVNTFGCNGQGNQKWVRNADHSFTGVQSGLCLDVDGGGTDSPNGTPLIVWTCNNGDNQKWLRR